ncbi:uncharacterized protein SCHCODRAFT_02460811, partial [Schizophyllum commune H4-8]|uniref:uncharacterized protein n=1 Tax=Schizophyllum commune (strain H4-8 / FGSC 9210) TaxID=578458 RepID=UPI00215E4ADB
PLISLGPRPGANLAPGDARVAAPSYTIGTAWAPRPEATIPEGPRGNWKYSTRSFDVPDAPRSWRRA